MSKIKNVELILRVILFAILYSPIILFAFVYDYFQENRCH